MEKKEQLTKAISPILEEILDRHFEEDELQQVDFKSILLSLVVSIMGNYATDAINVCYSSFKEKIVPILVKTNHIDVDEEQEEELFLVSYNVMHDETLDRDKLHQLLSRE